MILGVLFVTIITYWNKCVQSRHGD